MKKTLVMMLVVSLMTVTVGCEMTRSQKGAAVGSSTGAVIGAAIGNKSGNTIVGAIVGAAIGGAAGAYIGDIMDKQAAEIERDIEGATVERVGEGIKITFDSGILFEVDKADLQPVASSNIDKLAVILNKYDDTNVLIEGHTDSSGPEDYNMELSRKRSESVASRLAMASVAASRFTLVGYGEIQPVASNDSAEGRRQNRRVEIAIMANDKLKKAAKDKAEG